MGRPAHLVAPVPCAHRVRTATLIAGQCPCSDTQLTSLVFQESHFFLFMPLKMNWSIFQKCSGCIWSCLAIDLW